MPEPNINVNPENQAAPDVQEPEVNNNTDIPPNGDTPPKGNEGATNQDTNIFSGIEGNETPPTNPLVDWKANLPDDLKGHERLVGIDTVEDLAKAVAEAKLAPSVPNADDYQLPQGAPEYIKSEAHKLGVTQDQLTGFVNMFSRLHQENASALESRYIAEGKEVVKEWGAESKARLAGAQETLNYLNEKVGPGITEMLMRSKVATARPVLQVLDYVHSLHKEKGMFKSDSNTPSSRKSYAQILFDNTPAD